MTRDSHHLTWFGCAACAVCGAIILAALLGLAVPAQAQGMPCGDGAAFVAHLEKDWGEDPNVIALDAAGRMVRILVNPETGTWSMLVTGPGGPTCLISHGSAWEAIHQERGTGDPS